MRHQPLVHCQPGSAEAAANYVTQHTILACCWGTDAMQLLAQLPTFHLGFAAYRVLFYLLAGSYRQAFDSRLETLLAPNNLTEQASINTGRCDRFQGKMTDDTVANSVDGICCCTGDMKCSCTHMIEM